MAEFRVGEIAIVWYAFGPSKKNGDECEIVALAGPADYVSPITGKLIFAGKFLILYRGEHYQCFPCHLRKRRPPPDWQKLCNLDSLPKEIDCAV